jgi:hypothetical protein
MRALGIALCVLAGLLFVALFGCWAAAIWTGDSRWGEMPLALFLAMTCVGLGGGITVSFAPIKVG